MLLQSKANVNHVTEGGDTPLFVASANGHNEVVQLLLQNKADANHSVGGYTPLDIARLILAATLG